MNRRRALVLTGILLAAGIAAAGSDATTHGPNGRIVYMREVHGHFRLFTIRPDGRKETQITRGSADAGTPDWSPDGRLIAFGYETPPANGSVALISPRGKGLRLLTPTGAEPPPKGHVWNGNPAFTPDGQQIVFVRKSRARRQRHLDHAHRRLRPAPPDTKPVRPQLGRG